MSNNLPAIIEPLEKPVPVDVSIKVPVVTDEQAVRALRRQGGVTLRNDFLRDMTKVGIYLNGAGVLRTTDGLAIVSMTQAHRIAQEIAMLAERVPKGSTNRRKKEVTPEMVEMMSNLARAHGSLMGKINESLAIIRERHYPPAKSTLNASDIAAPKVPSFPEGAKIEPAQTMIVAQHVHMGEQNDPSSPVADLPQP